MLTVALPHHASSAVLQGDAGGGEGPPQAQVSFRALHLASVLVARHTGPYAEGAPRFKWHPAGCGGAGGGIVTQVHVMLSATHLALVLVASHTALYATGAPGLRWQPRAGGEGAGPGGDGDGGGAGDGGDGGWGLGAMVLQRAPISVVCSCVQPASLNFRACSSTHSSQAPAS